MRFAGDVGGAKGAWPRWEVGECVYLVEVWRGEVARLLGNQAAILVESSQAASTSSLSPAAKMNVRKLHVKNSFCDQILHKPFVCTVEPLYNERIGTANFFHYLEVFLY